MATIRTRSISSGEEATGCGGKIFLTVFFSFFLAIGGFMATMIVREVGRNLETFSWDEVPCEIVSAEVEETNSDESPYRLNVEYTYAVGGQSYTAGQWKLSNNQSGDYGKLYRLAVEDYAPGTEATCFVDPENPGGEKSVILKRTVPWFAFVIPLPLIFVFVGAGGIYFIWRKSRADKGETKSISEKATKRKVGRGFLIVFFSIFFLAGAGFLFGMFVPTIWMAMRSRNWKEVPAKVLMSNVRRHSGDESDTYSVDIVYSYEFEGNDYRSNRYKFMGGSSSGRTGKARIVRDHPPGKEITAYVSPDDPWKAVINRGLTSDLLFALIPLAFMAVGGGGLVYQLRKRGEPAAAAVVGPDWTPSAKSAAARAGARATMPMADGETGPVILKPKWSPLMKLIGAIFFALFWNGIVSIFVVQLIQSFSRGRPEWFLALFLTPFILVGLVLIGLVVYTLLGLFNPRPTLTISRAAIPLSETADLSWDIKGKVRSINRLRLFLEGREEATYRRGTSTHTDTKTFAEIPIFETKQYTEMSNGNVELKVPHNTMHSFEASNNKIVWVLKVHGDIDRWPDVDEEFPIVVHPMPHSQRSETQ